MISDYDIYKRNNVTFHCLITLQSPLSHIGETIGNVSNLKTLKLLDLEEKPRQCFVYSGNALRNGLLRRKGMASMLEYLDIVVPPDLHHTLFAGGRIDGSTDSDMELDKNIRQILPGLSVLGTAKPVGVFGHNKSQMIQGRINIGSAYLICYESLRYIYQQCKGVLEYSELVKEVIESQYNDPFKPPTMEQQQDRSNVLKNNIPFLRDNYKSWTEFLTIDQTIRKDSLKDPLINHFLKEKSSAEKKSDQMIANDRLIIGGSKLYSRWDFIGTDIEEGFIYDALLNFAKTPYLGGKGNRGNGLVNIKIWLNDGIEQKYLIDLDKPLLADKRVTTKLFCYREHLKSLKGLLDNKDPKIKSFLQLT